MKLTERLFSTIDKLVNRRVYPLRRKRRKNKSTRETFVKMYTNTCERVLFHAFELSPNKKDAMLITRDAFAYMYNNIGDLRKSQSLDVWQKGCTEKAFRALLRTRLLSRAPDEDAKAVSLSMSEAEKDDLWDKINRMTTIDPWRLVPEPGKSTVFSVLADQTVSDLRFMSVGDYILAVGVVLVALFVIVYGTAFAINYVVSHQSVALEADQEIFLDERNYTGYSQESGTQVDAAQVIIERQSAENTEIVTSETDRKGVAAEQNTFGKTAGEPVLTENSDLNAKLKDALKSITDSGMSDFEVLAAIYSYVGRGMTYSESGEAYDYETFAAEFFDSGRGDSRHYAAAVCALCRAAGYRCEVVEGGFTMNKGTEFERIVSHSWNSVNLGSINYYLDLEADCNADGTSIRTFYFMAADGNSKWELFERDHYFI